MADRRRQILQLYASRYDGLYLPAGSLVSAAGFVPAEREPCTSCGGIRIVDDFGRELRRRKGRGYILDRYQRRQPCTACGGEQDDRGRWTGGWIARDPMDAQHARIGSTTTTSTARPRRTVKCDRCAGEGVWKGERCELCDGAGRRDLHVFELHLDTRDVDLRDPLSAAVDERNESGSYAELERAIVGIVHHVNKPVRYRWLTDNATAAVRLLDELYLPPVTRTDVELTPAERALVDLAIAYIDSRMPATIVVPAEVQANAKIVRERRTRAHGRGSHPKALEQRAREMRDHARAGRSPQWIAAEYGVSVSTVYGVVNRRTA